MSDIFLSYSKKNLDRARAVERELEKLGWEVFRDQEMVPGMQWREHILSELKAARCVVVLWSEAALRSHFVIEEAEFGRQESILVPARIETVRPAFGFAGLHTTDLVGWKSDPAAESFRNLVAGIERIIGPPSRKPTAGKTRQEAATKKTTARRQRAAKPKPVASDPEKAAEHLAAGKQLLLEGSEEAALGEFDLALGADPASDEIAAEIVEALSDQSQDLQTKGIALLEAALELDPQNPDLHGAHGSLSMGLGNLDSAIESFQRAIDCQKRRMPRDLPQESRNYILGTRHMDLAEALERSGEHKRAEQETAKAKRLGVDWG